MKVLLVNSDFSDNGCTQFGLEYFAEELKKQGIGSELYVVKEKEDKYSDFHSFINGCADELSGIMKNCDGLMYGGAEKYCGINGEAKLLADRFFDVCPEEYLAFKAASPFISLRRDGGSNTHNQVNMYFLSHHMNVIPSSYMRIMHGTNVEECKRDVEALEALENLALNYAYYFQMREFAKEDGIEEPVHDAKVNSNYIRSEAEY